MKNSLSQIRLTLFFTRGVSLRVWDEVGILKREVALYNKLVERGIEVGFVTYGNNTDLRYASRLQGIRVLCNYWNMGQLKYERWLPLLHAGWLRRSHVIKTNQTDGADIALRTARFWNKPLIARCGYMWSYFATKQYGAQHPKVSYIRQIETDVFSCAKKIVLTTPMMVHDICRRIPAVKERIALIPNYVDIEHFYPVESTVKKDYEIIFVGRISPQKNVESLLKAILPLDVRMILIGDGEFRNDLEKKFLFLNGKIQWQGCVPNFELPRYLNRAALYVIPSYYEGHPKTLIEAMACGLPVIGADSPGIRELIRHGETGLLCGTDPNSIRKEIQKLLASAGLRKQLGLNARRFVVNNFTLSRIVDLELSVLHGVVS